MTPQARSKQAPRLWWRTLDHVQGRLWHRQHARAIRRADRLEQEMYAMLPQALAMLHAWAVAQDGQVLALPPYRSTGPAPCHDTGPAPAQQALYHRYREKTP